MADDVTDLARIAAALEELVAIERGRLEDERAAKAARRAARPPRAERKASAEGHRTAATVLRRLGVR
jgi:hypothetical protein